MVLEIVLIIVILLFILMYAGTVRRLQSKIDAANAIRLGYERKCNSFRIKYAMLSGLERPEKVLEKARQLKRSLYVYGGGVVGGKFLDILRRDKEIKVLRVIESNEFRADPAMAGALDKDALIVVTAMFDYENIVRLLQERGIPMENIAGLDEFL